MARMTEEEADVLDEEITNADITLKPGQGGIFTRQRDYAMKNLLLSAATKMLRRGIYFTAARSITS